MQGTRNPSLTGGVVAVPHFGERAVCVLFELSHLCAIPRLLSPHPSAVSGFRAVEYHQRLGLFLPEQIWVLLIQHYPWGSFATAWDIPASAHLPMTFLRAFLLRRLNKLSSTTGTNLMYMAARYSVHREETITPGSLSAQPTWSSSRSPVK